MSLCWISPKYPFASGSIDKISVPTSAKFLKRTMHGPGFEPPERHGIMAHFNDEAASHLRSRKPLPALNHLRNDEFPPSHLEVFRQNFSFDKMYEMGECMRG
jgi:hypothetical protein